MKWKSICVLNNNGIEKRFSIDKYITMQKDMKKRVTVLEMKSFLKKVTLFHIIVL